MKSASARRPDIEVRPLCESCRLLPATIVLIWPDQTTFDVCAGCTPEGLVNIDVSSTLIEEEF